jgi:glycosyltransferase involved in cell wall biosynthesis
MNNEPLVSAIIIFLNGEKFLTEAIESVLNQTYTNWELLLVDDGSTDRGTEIARSYANSLPNKIKYLEHEGHQNRGMSATRNLGISRSKGDLVGFLDADDIWLPDKLAEQVSVFHQNPDCGMVYGRTEIWHSWSENPDDIAKDHFYPLGVNPDSVVHPPKIALLLLENKAQSPTTCNALLKKDVFEKVGLFLDDFKGMFEDAAFFIKVGLAFPVYVSDKVWAKYRQHDESCTVVSEKSKADEQARYKFLKWFKAYINSNKIFSFKIRIALYKELLFQRGHM